MPSESEAYLIIPIVIGVVGGLTFYWSRISNGSASWTGLRARRAGRHGAASVDMEMGDMVDTTSREDAAEAAPRPSPSSSFSSTTTLVAPPPAYIAAAPTESRHDISTMLPETHCRHW